jgi:ribosome-binding factor A
MRSLRHQRVRELLKRTVGDILRRELSPEECGLVSVNDVGVANDLKSATIFVSVLGSEEQKYFAGERLEKDRSHIQYTLGREVVLKYTPKIKFSLNTSIEDGDRVLTILKEIEKDGKTPQ